MLTPPTWTGDSRPPEHSTAPFRESVAVVSRLELTVGPDLLVIVAINGEHTGVLPPCMTLHDPLGYVLCVTPPIEEVSL